MMNEPETPDLARLAPPGMVRRAGFYPDPARVAAERYWDGKQWTDRTRARGEKPGGLSPLAFWGIILAFIFPIGGAIIAIILFARSQIGPALAVLVACGVGMVVFLALAGG
jgi:hypothetical protein